MASRLSHRPQRVSAAIVTTVTRELAELLIAGLPLLSALDLLVDGGGKHRSALLQLIRDRVAQGQSLSAILRRYPQQFDMLYLRLVALGEASGKLADMLMCIADDRERRADQRTQLRQALIYPAFVCTVALGVVLALMLWAVPAFEQLFDNFGAPLPALTVSVLWMSRTLTGHAGILTVGAVVAVVALSVLMGRSARVRHAGVHLVQKLPVIGALLMQIAVARWASGLAALLSAGMPLVEALMSIAEHDRYHAKQRTASPLNASMPTGRPGQPIAPHAHPDSTLGFEQASERLAQRLRTGDSFAAAIRHVGGFPPVVVRTIDIAEHTASLERMLKDLGRRTNVDAQRRLRSLIRLIEPAVISVAGAFIAVLVLSLYLPIIKLGDVV